MEITGMIRVYNEFNYNNPEANNGGIASGAFYHKGNAELPTNYSGASGSSDGIWNVKFQASRAWTGNTSTVGANQPHNTLQPIYGVYKFRRVN